jgi:tRNA dimethylallyltransferase
LTHSAALAIVGPTGSGKSALALALARRFGGEIVNCDSLQLYRFLDIGTAKPSLEERSQVPHHLFDVLDPDTVFTAGDYSRLARPVLREIAGRGRLPVVVGGTGFYLRALIDGLFPGPGKDQALRDRLASKPQRLHKLLTRLDPKAANAIHPNDTKKLIRALEISILTRRPISAVQAELGRDRLENFSFLKIGLNPPREELKLRLNQRTAGLFETGLIDEIRHVLNMGFPPTSKAFESIGYREGLMHIAGQLTIAEAIVLAQAATRQYAKRQLTWFRKEHDIHWLSSFGDQGETIQNAIGLVEKFQKYL